MTAPSTPVVKRLLRRLAVAVAALVGIALTAAALLIATVLFSLRAGPDEWSLRVSPGGIGFDLSVPALIRVATHPLGVRVLAGRSVTTRHGRVEVRQGPTPSSLVLVCAPCTVTASALAARPIRVARAELSVEHGAPNSWRGIARVDRVTAIWQARLSARGADLELRLAEVPVADLVALFGSNVPEAGRARIAGHAGAIIRLRLPERRFTIEPHIDGLAVAGLGSEALAFASPTPACARLPRAARSVAPFGPWLGKAVIAAEDQRFLEHPGYDLVEMAAAWSSPLPGSAAPPPWAAPQREPQAWWQAQAWRHHDSRRGASTLSQQLAKLLFTGEERSAARKLRELLYAVEIDRTLGKARVLQLYLALAPWGDGQCGGEAAALHYFGKHAAQLDAAEAVWLASLLRNPEAQLEREARGAVDRSRLAAIAEAIRPMPRRARESLQHELLAWVPPPVVLLRARERLDDAPPALAARR